MKFRTYEKLECNTQPIVDGIVPDRLNVMPGKIHAIAWSARRPDGTILVSLWDEENDRAYQEVMTFEKLAEIEKKDGITLVEFNGEIHAPFVEIKHGKD